MPEIKIKHVVSFSSEDKVHKAENLIKPETYRQWKCATPGEKSATVVFQFEKATQIHSIDIGNAHSAFIEVLVGRSSQTVSDYQVLLVASSFMSPLESRCGKHANRVRMFGPEKLSQTTKDEKWDCVQVVCTQPFNKQAQYGLSFVKFHSPPEKNEEHSKTSETTTMSLGSFKLRYDEDDDDSLIAPGLLFGKKKASQDSPDTGSSFEKTEPSYASAVLASSSNGSKTFSQSSTPKRKMDETSNSSDEPPVKKASTAPLDKGHIVYKDVLRGESESGKVPEANNSSKKNTLIAKLDALINSPGTSSKKAAETNGDLKKNVISKPVDNKKTPATPPQNKPNVNKKTPVTTPQNKPNVNKKPPVTTPQSRAAANNQPGKVPFEKIMDKVVIALSGFVNPLRSELREKALEMGAKYRGDWDSSCTHLVCAFINTPKYVQVKQLKGNIVKKEWILDCHQKKQRIPWTRYILGKRSRDRSDKNDDESDDDEVDGDESDESEYSEYSEEETGSEEFNESEGEDEEYTDKRKKKRNNPKNAKKAKTKSPPNTKKNAQASPAHNKILKASVKKEEPSSPSKAATSVLSPKKPPNSPPKKAVTNTSIRHNVSDDSGSPTLLPPKDESETEDEDALEDYRAATDVDDDSGGDTEDEIRKVEMAMQKNVGSPLKKEVSKEDSEYPEKPDVTDLPLPELPNLFKQKRFFLFGDFSPSKQHDMQRYIVAYNGVIEDYMNDKIKYVITDAKWGKEFEDALNENEDLIFVKPAWIYKCHDAGKFVPFQPYIVIPDS